MTEITTRGKRLELERELANLADPARAASSAWFFKTGKGEYGEGDRFLGITVPAQRKIAIRYRHLPLPDVARLLHSPFHEHRFTALEILVAKYERPSSESKEEIFRFYLGHTSRINNWDLVDTSAPYIVGDHLLLHGSRKLLDRLAESESVWERRIAIVSTLWFIRNGEIEDTFRIAEKLLQDKHSLIHKAVGWALREAGKVSRPQLVRFLRQHRKAIPRTAFRYAVERFPPEERRNLLSA